MYEKLVQDLHPEVFKYAEMHLSSKIKEIPWEEIYKLVLENKDTLYKQVQDAICKFNNIPRILKYY